MKKIFTLLLILSSLKAMGQLNVDTLAIQDFEIVPASPTWTFTGPVIYNSGTSTASAAPPNSPIGIGGSRAWETTVNSTGLVLDFANVSIPGIYDSVRVRFRLAAMNLIGSTGGPDDLDYVLVELSTNGGSSFYGRMRIRGAVANNSFWPYSATGFAYLYYQPQSEVVFQPTASGLQTTLGYSTCEIVFPGSVTQVKVRMTGRSSSSTDTWLVDNLVITGENVCSPTASSISPTACDSFVSPAGNIYTSSGSYTDIIPNSVGCDSVISINLSITNSSSQILTQTSCGPYTLNGQTYSSTGTYTQTLSNASGCDSIITLNLTVNSASSNMLTLSSCNPLTLNGQTYNNTGVYTQTLTNAAGCDSVLTIQFTRFSPANTSISPSTCGGSYLSPAGNTYSVSGTYYDTLLTTQGCDSVITINLSVNITDTLVNRTGNTLSANATNATYQWLDCANGFAVIPGATNATFTSAGGGNFALMVTQNGCSDTSGCHAISATSAESSFRENSMTLYPNPAQDYFRILANDPSEFNLEIFGMKGESIYASEKNKGILTISTQNWAPGIYLVKISQGNQVFSERIRILPH